MLFDIEKRGKKTPLAVELEGCKCIFMFKI